MGTFICQLIANTTFHAIIISSKRPLDTKPLAREIAEWNVVINYMDL